MSGHAYWYVTRGTGIASLILLTAVLAIGIAGSLRLRSERWPRFVVVGLHRNLTLLTLAFLGVHIVTTVLDSYTPIGIVSAVVPFVAHYRPIWLGLGAIAFDLLLALTVTSLLRARIGYRTWRALHWLAYASWPVALAHGLGTGSDARFGWMQAITVVCALAVLLALVARLSRAAVPAGRRALAGATALALAIGGAVWYRSGPGAHGWAGRAGTPSSLLGRATQLADLRAPTQSTQTLADVPAVPFAAELQATLATASEGDGLVRVDIRGRTSGDVDGRLWIRLEGRPIQDGGVAMTASGVRFGPSTSPDLYAGSIRALQGTQMLVALRNARGRRLDLSITLNVDQVTSSVTGSIRATQ